MALVLNASCEPQRLVVFGHHFNLKPGQIKNFTDEISSFVGYSRRNQGLVVLPESFEDPEYINSEEGQKKLIELKAQGIHERVKHLRSVIYNNQVSLKQDLEKANLKIDPRVLASDGEVAAMEELSKYQAQAADEEAAKLDKIRSLEKKIGNFKG